MNKYALLSLLIFTSSSFLFCQNDQPVDVLSISAGAGVLTFNGDVGKGKDVSAYTYIRGGYTFSVEKRFMNGWLGASLNAMTGKLAMGERSIIPSRNNNFESKMTQFGLQMTFYVQNRKERPVIPFLNAGISYAMLKAYTDIKFNGDSLYYYWDDGSIRNLPQITGNEFLAHYVNRDYIYETAVDSADKSALAIPIGGGIRLKIGNKAEAGLGATYHFSMADGIDAFALSGKDKYLYSYFSFTYTFQQKSKQQREQERKASSVDFASIDKLDQDGDGVKDVDDICPGTPKSAKTDAKGCPLDTDGDGVADYMDKEPATRKGSLVDSEGKTLTDAMILQKARKDSIASERTNIFSNNPSMESLKKVDADIKNKQQTGGPSKIPAQFQAADLNKDGIISSSEITAVIDGFFDGSNDYTVEKIHALIDYFFEQ